MSKEVDLTKPLSENDLRYLVDRDRWDDIRTNAANLGLPEPVLPSARGLRAQVPRFKLPRPDAFDDIAKQLQVQRDEPTEDAPEIPVPEETGGEQTEQTGGEPVDYTKLTVPQLKEEMDNRRKQYEQEDDTEGVELMTYSSDTRKDDLVSALQMDDEEDDSGDDDQS